MTTGDTVYLAFATVQASDNKPSAFVTAATVLDATHGVLRLASGQVFVHEPLWGRQTIHVTEADAWAACASRLASDAAAVTAESSRCAARAAEAAAASRVVRVPA